jgi:RNA polymerase sigma-70 factor (ECF subfamily)
MDENEIIAFYKEFSPRISRYLKRHLPKNEVSEILNDIFFEVIDDIAILHKKDNLSAWIYKIAHNKVVDFYRKKKIKSFLLSQVPYLDLMAREITQPEFILEKNQLRDKIESSMRAISQKYRNILHMHYEEQMPIKKIALVLNLSPKATESLLYRARQHFMKAYERT